MIYKHYTENWRLSNTNHIEICYYFSYSQIYFVQVCHNFVEIIPDFPLYRYIRVSNRKCLSFVNTWIYPLFIDGIRVPQGQALTVPLVSPVALLLSQTR